MVHSLARWLLGSSVVREIQLSPISGLVANVDVGSPAQHMPMALHFRPFVGTMVLEDHGFPLTPRFDREGSLTLNRSRHTDRVTFGPITRNVTVGPLDPLMVMRYGELGAMSSEVGGIIDMTPRSEFFMNRIVSLSKSAASQTGIQMEISSRAPEADFWLPTNRSSAYWKLTASVGFGPRIPQPGAVVIDLSCEHVVAGQEATSQLLEDLGDVSHEMRDSRLFVDCGVAPEALSLGLSFGQGHNIPIPGHLLLLPAVDSTGLCPTRIMRNFDETWRLGVFLLEAVGTVILDFDTGRVGFAIQGDEHAQITRRPLLPLYGEPHIDEGPQGPSLVFPTVQGQWGLVFTGTWVFADLEVSSFYLTGVQEQTVETQLLFEGSYASVGRPEFLQHELRFRLEPAREQSDHKQLEVTRSPSGLIMRITDRS